MPYCGACGREYILGLQACSQCGADLAAPPSVLQQPSTASFATPGLKRVMAGLIDAIIAYGLLCAVVIVISRRVPFFRGLTPLALGLGLLIPNPYLLLKDAVEGKSVGKLVLGLVAFNEKEGRAGGLLDSVIRNWYLAIPLFGPTLFMLVIGFQIVLGRERRLGDRWADTVVITDLDYQRVR